MESNCRDAGLIHPATCLVQVSAERAIEPQWMEVSSGESKDLVVQNDGPARTNAQLQEQKKRKRQTTRAGKPLEETNSGVKPGPIEV